MSGIDDFFDLLIETVSAIIPILVGVAVLVFFWGMVKFIAHAGDEKAREGGKSIMIWGIIALFVMVSLWSLVGFLQESLGFDAGGPTSGLSELPEDIPTPI